MLITRLDRFLEPQRILISLKRWSESTRCAFWVSNDDISDMKYFSSLGNIQSKIKPRTIHYQVTAKFSESEMYSSIVTENLNRVYASLLRCKLRTESCVSSHIHAAGCMFCPSCDAPKRMSQLILM